MKSLVVCGSFLLLGCSLFNTLPDHYNIILDPTFTATEQAAIINAANIWTTKNTNLHIDSITISDKCDPKPGNVCVVRSSIAMIASIYGHLTSASIPHGTEELGITVYFGALGAEYTDNRFKIEEIETGSTIYLGVDGIVAGAEFSHVIQHELGHSFDLQHTGENTVMYGMVEGAAQDVMCADVKQYNDLRNLTTECKGE
jgi:hypothetical protein